MSEAEPKAGTGATARTGRLSGIIAIAIGVLGCITLWQAGAFTAVIELEPEESAHYHFRGEAYLRSGDPGRAIPDLTRALAGEPDCASTLVLRGEAYSKAGQPVKAGADYARAIELDPDGKWAARAREAMKEIAQ